MSKISKIARIALTVAAIVASFKAGQAAQEGAGGLVFRAGCAITGGQPEVAYQERWHRWAASCQYEGWYPGHEGGLISLATRDSWCWGSDGVYSGDGRTTPEISSLICFWEK